MKRKYKRNFKKKEELNNQPRMNVQQSVISITYECIRKRERATYTTHTQLLYNTCNNPSYVETHTHTKERNEKGANDVGRENNRRSLQ